MTAAAASAADRFATARAVADTVLYEGYLLYPYRASTTKNQLRWQFGVLVPPAGRAIDPSERCSIRTECLVDPGAGAPRLAVRVRCLVPQPRPGAPLDEGVEHEVDIPGHDLHQLVNAARIVQFRFPSAEGPVEGNVVLGCTPVEGGLLKVTVEVENSTPWAPDRDHPGREDVMRRALVAVHTMLAVDDGRFVSLLDPPAAAQPAVPLCENDGTFPVLISPDHDVMLSSPIILYDHPMIAPESPGDLFDATEIDEILALRVLTLTDDEKAEARATDPRAAAIVDRVEGMPPELWARLHGAVRPLAPEPQLLPVQAAFDLPWWEPEADAAVDPLQDTVRVGDVEVRTGTKVWLRPSRRADAQDLFLADQLATVAAVFHDVDGCDHLAVVLDDDPGADLAEAQGRYFYFSPDEVEPA